MEIDKVIQAIGRWSCLTGPGWMQWAGSRVWPDGLGVGFEWKANSARREEWQQQDGRVKWAEAGWMSSKREGRRSSTWGRGKSVDTPLAHSSQGMEIVYIPPGEDQGD